MTSQQLQQAELLDIVFQNRNKGYGAYALRRTYNQRLSTALILSISIVFIAIVLLKPNASSSHVTLKPDWEVTAIELTPYVPQTPPEEQPAPQPATKSIAASKQFNGILITPNPTNTELVPAQIELAGAVIGKEPVEGIAGAAGTPGNPGSTGSSTAKALPVEAPIAEAVSSAPEFPGGTAAWAQFLKRHLRAPDALDAGEKKSVHVRFLVSTDGSVTGFEVLQSGGPAFDNEVLRVLKKMPRWKPAYQKGQAITVNFTQPVTFIGEQD